MGIHIPKDLQLWPVTKLVPYERNARTHSDEQVDQIAASIQEFGFTNPILVDSKNGIIAGHGRLAAANKIGLEQVPVIVLDSLTDAQRRAYIIADNKLALNAGWDLSMLGREIEQLEEEGFDLDLLGFSDAELEELMPEVEEHPGEDEKDEEPEPLPDPKVVRGEVYILGPHRLLCGDATSIDDVDKLMSGQKADLVFTDPPYNTGMSNKEERSRMTGGGARGEWLSHFFDDAFTDEEWEALLSGMCASYWAATKDSAVLYVCLDWRRSHELVPHLKNHFKFSNLIIWDKIVHGLGSDYKYTHEFIHVCKKGDPSLDTHQGDREYQDVWRIQRKIGRDDDHATKKPIELVERAIRHSSKKRDIVLDLFGGSGSTLIAADSTGRVGYLMELEPRYCQVILDRWQKFTGNKAHREDGVPWDEIRGT